MPAFSRRQPDLKPAGAAPLSISRPAQLPNHSDAAFRRLIYRMIITQSRLLEIRKRIAMRVGVSSAQYPMLMAILRLGGEGGVSISQLADYLEVTGPHITGEIKRLVAAGYVRKSPNPRDQRSVHVRLSSFGRKRLLAAFDYIRQINDILFDGVSAEEFKALSRFNQKFMATTSAALEWTEKSSGRQRDIAGSAYLGDV